MFEKIRTLYSTNLVTIRITDDLSKADGLMNSYNIRHLPVVNEHQHIVGIISKSDFIALKYVDSRLKDFKVNIFMSSPVTSVDISASIKDVAQLFISKKINSVLVLQAEEVKGILTSEDLIRFLADDGDYLEDRNMLDIASLAEGGWISLTTLI
jgi:CBS domain-containing protein